MNKPFIKDQIYLKKLSEIGGWGVFTNEDIKKGEVLELSPVMIYPKKIIDMSIYIMIGEGMKHADVKIDQYAIIWDNDHAALMFGYLSLYNHSDKNNTTFFKNDDEHLIGVLAIRDIKKEEQITVSYGPDWFATKNYINKIDL
jgi:SET domain-containing protein